MNAVLTKSFAGHWHIGGFRIGTVFVGLTLISEGALLFVAAQAGFIDGPRVLANMAVDSWMPHAFAALSERLTMRNGVYLMGGAALLTLIYTGGDVHTLAVMYSINVFLTFSLSNLGMSAHWWRSRHKAPEWKQHFMAHAIGLVLCAGILTMTVLERFLQGGWVTLVITGALVFFCYWVQAHYRMVSERFRVLNHEALPHVELAVNSVEITNIPEEMEPELPTAVLLTTGFGALGVQALERLDRLFPGQFRQAVFVSVGVIDSGSFKGIDEMEALRHSCRGQLVRYVEYARNHFGWSASYEIAIGTEAVESLEELCRDIYLRFPRSLFIAGKLIFREPSWWHRLLHNETAEAVQRRLLFDGLPMIILPVRVLR